MTADLLAPTATRPPAPAKLRILETADRLFTDEGIRTVGIDRLIQESRVTKATFYKHYGAKERLVLDYVRNRHRQEADALVRRAADGDAEAAVRALLGATLAELDRAGFRGDAFLNTAAEFPDRAHPVRAVVTAHRDWFAAELAELLRELGHDLPGDAADDLVLARDGAMSGAYAGDPIAAGAALTRAFERAIAEARA
ncbi:TetR/AcrR family transcriptional regulator [Homoserinibacter sp. YIM 151385]|uniref:TetR/AcrR family transcriptional regulator n=1 Tax=Homoserinibacter sp. YIM 151385 TaxID=2985506 RepID=UPI0022F037AF|nr:TetR/AcrR family transcriptional regulator [Homoserinibacter sp. YIM 151385]WBU38916.1 helix-turn-helix domain containing protein [Homoserinibacter sp. YIM 151385]